MNYLSKLTERKLFPKPLSSLLPADLKRDKKKIKKKEKKKKREKSMGSMSNTGAKKNQFSIILAYQPIK